ncbi:putative methyltransferase [Daldinia bambusicola]|nr:putative methyltransferase [Daldinia bambusicola]
MSQNNYDRQDFFENYIKLDRQVKGLEGAPEWAQLRAMLPDLNGLSVLDLGCGFGWFSRFARENGAELVRAIDISEKMLKGAGEMTSDDQIKYERADLEELRLAEGKYDLIFSSLAFHYVANIAGLIKEIGVGLKPSGRLVCSIEHPIYTAPSRPKFLGNEETGDKSWPLNNYQKEGPRISNWLAPGIEKQHRTVGTYINTMLRNNLQLTDFVEWCPTEEELKRVPTLESEVVRPTFLLLGATRY